MRGLLGLAFAILLGMPGAAAGDDSDGAWFPLETGPRGHFDVHRDQLVRPAEGPPLRTLWVGRAAETGERREGRLRVRTVTRESVVEQNGIAVALAPVRGDDADDYSRSDGALLLHRRDRVADGRSEAVDYDPPLRILAGTLAPGTRWSVGTLRERDLEISVQAEVVGREDLSLTSGQQLEGCLRVAYRGAIRAAGSGRQTPALGRWERDAWFARGIGVVQEITRLEVEREEKGQPVSFTETLRRSRRPEVP